MIGFSFLILFEGCSKTPTAPVTVKIDPTLPMIIINGTLSDRQAIAFEWKTLNDPDVDGVYIYRNDPTSESKKLHRIDAIKNRFATHYVDTEVLPGKTYQYRFSAYNNLGSESKTSKTITVTTLPKLEAVSYFASIDQMPRTAKLIWRPHTDINVKGYTLERKTDETDSKYTEIATINGRLNAEYIDTKLKDKAHYSYRLYAITYDNLTSKPSAVVSVITKAIPLNVQQIKATQNQPKKITITWKANREKDIDFYNIYRSEQPESGFKYYVKLNETYFTDKTDLDGKTYFYKVSAVDSDGLESHLSKPIQGTSLKAPAAPLITSAKITDKAARLHWKVDESRVNSYIIIKVTQKSWLSKTTQEIRNISETQFTDVNIMTDQQYAYSVIAVDKNGIRSEPSEIRELIFEKVKP